MLIPKARRDATAFDETEALDALRDYAQKQGMGALEFLEMLENTEWTKDTRDTDAAPTNRHADRRSRCQHDGCLIYHKDHQICAASWFLFRMRWNTNRAPE